MSDGGNPSTRVRREPPRFRVVDVHSVERLSPRMTRLTFTGGDLEGLIVEQPAASVRLLLPSSGEDDLVIPEWDGNQFLLPDGSRATIRTFTPRRVDPVARRLDLWIVVHGGGVASEWAEGAERGDPAAVSGPGRGYDVDPAASAFLLAGDETAIPAISQLLGVLPETTPVQVHIEVAHADGILDMPAHPSATVAWHHLPGGAAPGEALVAAIRGADLVEDARVWAAGEAGAMYSIRQHLFEERQWPRPLATVRGYWKHGRAGK